MAAHRYWRIYITASSDNYTGFAEIALKSGGTNRIGSGTASASAAEGGHAASAAVDGSTATFWGTYPGTVPQWWEYDFGSGNAWDIDTVEITSRPDSYYAEAPGAFSVQYSDDNSSWGTAKSFTGVSWTASTQTKSFTVAELPGIFVSKANAYAVLAPPLGVGVSKAVMYAVLDQAVSPSWPVFSFGGGIVGSAYNQTFAALGTSPLTYSVVSGALPDDLSLTGDTISGTPSVADTFNFTLRATNTYGTSDKAFSITITTAADYPAESDVRDGVSYGNGAYEGTLVSGASGVKISARAW